MNQVLIWFTVDSLDNLSVEPSYKKKLKLCLLVFEDEILSKMIECKNHPKRKKEKVGTYYKNYHFDRIARKDSREVFYAEISIER